MSIASLVRPDIRNLRGYQATGVKTGSVLLHANEAPLAAGTGSAAGLNRYPPSRPAELTRKDGRVLRCCHRQRARNSRQQ